MSGWLLDTNVTSELRKPRCHQAVRAWSEAHAPELLYISRITIAEIRFGIEQHASGRFREQLEAWLDDELRPWFADRILEVVEEVILEWRRMVQRGKAAGHTFSQPDLFIAATAAIGGLSVVTRKLADFHLAGVAFSTHGRRASSLMRPGCAMGRDPPRTRTARRRRRCAGRPRSGSG